VVAVLTGNGLKDPDTAIQVSDKPTKLPAEFGRLEKLILGWA
jgi:threonine synthase